VLLNACSIVYFIYATNTEQHFVNAVNVVSVGGVAQWKNVDLWPANFPWPAPDLQLTGNHLHG